MVKNYEHIAIKYADRTYKPHSILVDLQLIQNFEDI